MGSLLRLASATDKVGNALRLRDINTEETIARFTAALLDEDFQGAGHLAAFPTSATTGYPWVAKITGAAPPTVGIVANSPGGVAACALTAASQAQEALLYSGDQLNWDATKSATFETRLAMSVLPTGVAEAVFGLHSAWNAAGPDATAVYVDFQLLGSGLVNVRIKDGVTGVQSQSSGVTLAAGAFHNFRFDLVDPTNVIFAIDGVRVGGNLSTKLTFAATGTAAVLQPYFDVFKASGTDVATMQIDSVQLGANRS
jgi:hypothetical protein